MADFHRRSTPTYFGGLPVGYDLINTPSDPSVGGTGAPAFADGLKSGGPNDGTYYAAFGEDATSLNLNRGFDALATNTDYLDDILHRDLAVTTRTSDVTAGSAVASVVITGGVFVGAFGTPNNADQRQRLISVLDANDQEIIDSSGNTVVPSLIHDGASANVVGVPADGFYTNPTINFSPSIPTGTTYRIYYGQRSNLATLPISALTDITIRGAEEVDGLVERQLRNLHAPANLQAWDGAWDSTIRALAAAGLNERYRRQTSVPVSFAFDTPGNGATIIRDGLAVTVRGAATTIGTTTYPDPALALYRAEADSTVVVGGSWPSSTKGGDVGYWHETDLNGSNTAAETSRAGASGPGYLDVIPRHFTSGTLTTQALTYINPASTATLNPDSLTGISDRATVQVAAGQYFKIPSGGNAGKTAIRLGLDILQVTVAGVTTNYVIEIFSSATRVVVRHMNGRDVDFGATATSATIRLLQPIVSLGGSASRGDGRNEMGLAVFAPPQQSQVGGDNASRRIPPPFFASPSAAFSEPANSPYTDLEPVAALIGYHDITTGQLVKTMQLRGDGQIRTKRGAWEFSVGDGVSSFGDFNGASAIRQVIDYVNSLSATWAVTVRLKAATFTVTGSSDTLTIPDGCRLHLYGPPGDSSADGARVLNSSAGAQATFTVSGSLSLDGVDVNADAAEIVYAIRLGVNSGDQPRLRMTRCRVRNSTINFFQSPGPHSAAGDFTIYAEDSYFEPGTLSSSGSVLRFATATAAAVVGSIKFTDCRLLGRQDSPLITINPSSTGGVLIDNLVFKECKINLAGSSGTVSNATRNSGILQSLAQDTDAFSQVKNLVFENCNVFGAGARPVLMYLQVSDSFVVNHMTIEGGTWLCDRGNTTVSINPFTVVPLTNSTGFGDLPFYSNGGEPLGMFSLKDVYVGYGEESGNWLTATATAGNYGAVPSDQSTHSPASWGCWVVRGETVVLRDVKFVGPATESTLPEFQLLGVHQLKMDNVHIYHSGSATNGNGSLPAHRVSVVAGSPNQGVADITGLIYHARGFTSVSYSIVALFDVPASAPPPASHPGWRVTFDKCKLGNLSITSNELAIGYGGFASPAYIDDFHVVITRCVLERCGYGIFFSSNLPQELIIENNWIYNHVHSGVHLAPAIWGPVNSVVIDANTIGSCGGPGIVCSASTSWGAGQIGAGPVITNNKVRDNNTSTTPDIQIIVGTVGLDRPGGIVLGNDCLGNNELGSIALYTDTAGVGYDIAGIDWEGHAAVQAQPLLYGSVPTNGTRFAHNNAKWYHN